MEDHILSPGTMMGVHHPLVGGVSGSDFDYMDQLFFQEDCCWLDATRTPFDCSYLLEVNNNNNNNNSNTGQEFSSMPLFQNNNNHEEEEEDVDKQTNSLFSNELQPSTRRTRAIVASQLGMSGGSSSSELGKRKWIGISSLAPSSPSVMERLTLALGFIRDTTKSKDTLIQVWVPVIRGTKHVLTTNDQPYSLGSSSWRLATYREISVYYQFPAEKDSAETVGLPGRVFLGKVPEWTPDVRLFRSDEYPRVNYAQQCDVRGTLALPIFERGSTTCLGVIEVVMTTQKLNYTSELESVCKALEAVDLSSSKDVRTQDVKACKASYEAALPEILEVLRSACVTHRLPLAQTWVSCVQQGKEGCRHSDENYMHCVSTVDSACFVADPHVRGFQEACSDHHLLKGQGVAGRAFITNQPCFSTDVTSFSKAEYPLSHHASMFGLHAAVAIRFRSVHTGLADFVLEFFLPSDCRDPEQQKNMLSSLSIIIEQVCRSLRVVTDKELEEETISSVTELIVPPLATTSRQGTMNVKHARSETHVQEESTWSARCREVQQTDKVAAPLAPREKVSHASEDIISGYGQQQQDSSCVEQCHYGESSFTIEDKAGEKRRSSKAEKTITLQVLRQHFAGSLKDAAKNLGVCPTTLKRICRIQGIKRWPSRKIKKVGHSLEKLQRVIDSVPGTSGTIQIGSFYSNFPELASSDVTETTTPFSNSKPSNTSKPISRQHADGLSSPNISSKSSSSSGSQSSGSSHSCSSATHQHHVSRNITDCEHDVTGEDYGDGVLKRVQSDAGLHFPSQEGLKIMQRSQSHVYITEHHHSSTRNIQKYPKSSDQIPREIDARRVKVSYGEENIRFRMQNSWKYEDLLHEISRRFNIDERNEFQIKYMDDDLEWVLLTCDADLEECLEVCQSASSQSNTIKLSLVVSDHNQGSSFGSSSPL